MSDGLSDAYRMQREAEEAEDAEKKDPRFDPEIGEQLLALSSVTHAYIGARNSFFHRDAESRSLVLLEHIAKRKAAVQTALTALDALLKSDKL